MQRIEGVTTDFSCSLEVIEDGEKDQVVAASAIDSVRSIDHVNLTGVVLTFMLIKILALHVMDRVAFFFARLRP